MKKAHGIALLLPLILLAACNTTAGAGKDLQSAGKEVEKAAEKAK
ncbi:MAG: entericidin EcnA/B family protein [Sphingomonas sp.]|nr:MAG: entericidin EcnA/B family protein [Sphingomonas sp.]